MAGFQREDTIAAIATPPGRGGVGIIRISGPIALDIGRRLSGRSRVKARHAYFSAFLDVDRAPIDQGVLLYFQAPASFTGEDVVEIQAHGGPMLMNMLLERVLHLGARPARAGEFSERAFLNGKLDLVQAEAIADLIDAQTRTQARAAQRSFAGEFSQRVQGLHEQLLGLRAFVEAAIDFPDEELDLLSSGQVHARLGALKAELERLWKGAQQGALLREGARVVLAGRPNAGKSSILNALAGVESAIVTPVPGTTRDVLREQIQIDGLPLHILDTAGIRESRDTVERMGMERARQAAREADLCLVVLDAAQDASDHGQGLEKELFQDMSPPSIIRIYNKIDLLPALPSSLPGDALPLSAKTGYGLDLLRRRIKERLEYGGESEGLFTARARHLDALRHCGQHVAAAQASLNDGLGMELLAEDLRQAAEALGGITGYLGADELLGEIFSRFCIGK